MSDSNISLPDPIPDPDWSEVKYLADSLLQTSISRSDDDDREEQQIISLIGEAVLTALYGPHVDEFVRELRERNAPED